MGRLYLKQVSLDWLCEVYITSEMKLIFLLSFTLLVASVYGQTKWCGLWNDCVCREDGCLADDERPSTINTCDDNAYCCCASEGCGIWGDCSCRVNCLPEERDSEIGSCSGRAPDGQPMRCCC